jgi:hypothetical protein
MWRVFGKGRGRGVSTLETLGDGITPNRIAQGDGIGG